MSDLILMIDDDHALTRLAEINLTKAGYRFVHAAHGGDGIHAASLSQPSLILLDISMPTLDGWETCRLIRESSTTPIIMLTGRDDEADKARGLDLGADDYLTKPFGFIELQARIRAVLRRAGLPPIGQAKKVPDRQTLGSLIVDVPAHTVLQNGTPVALTPTEFRLLQHLLQNAGLVLTHRELLTAVWGFAYGDAVDILKPAISRLRQKIEDNPAQPRLIQTVHGVGYRLVPPAEG